FRFFVEFFREPDAHIGFIIGPFTLGQVFSFIMIAGGTILYICLKRKD
ncbi:MAG: prolipoprotein diacylglyceryl transferase, partial [Deltaproteobacteria bacterium]|nr:prolipoprotein diacylglyceryl transferase [Deltaproteobacteria bacterium]